MNQTRLIPVFPSSSNRISSSGRSRARTTTFYTPSDILIVPIVKAFFVDFESIYSWCIFLCRSHWNHILKMVLVKDVRFFCRNDGLCNKTINNLLDVSSNINVEMLSQSMPHLY